MLVLSRKQREGIIIGDDVTIRVLAIRGGKVRVGINAPKKVSIHREEVHLKIERGEEQELDVSHG